MTVLQAAEEYLRMGLAPLPVPYMTKGPILKGWGDFRTDLQDVQKHFNGVKQNIGILQGAPSKGCADADLDCRAANIGAPYLLPPTRRFGHGDRPFSHWIYMAPGLADIEPKDTREFRDIDKTMLLELRSGGSGHAAQTVFPPSVHPSGEPITWADVRTFAVVDPNDLRLRVSLLAVACLIGTRFPAGGRHDLSYQVGGFLGRCRVPDGLIEATVEAAGRISGQVDLNYKEMRRTAIDGARAKTPAGFLKLAKVFGEDIAERIAEWLCYKGTKVEDEAPPNNGSPEAKPIVARPFVYRAPRSIPPRQWLYGDHYIRKFVSGTIAAPGIGKSSLDLVEAVAMVTGRPLLGVGVPKQLRVWYWNLEDPADEIERRIAAILLHFKIDPAEIEGRLFVNSGRDDPLVIAGMTKGGVTVHTPVIDALTAEIIARGIDVLTVDPFVSCHQVPENDNGAIDAVTKAWGKVADPANCSIDLVHHVRKPSNGQAEFDVNDARGASSFIGTVRAARVLNSMSKDDAEKARVPLKQKGYYFSVANGKATMSPPAEKADWHKFVSVPLGNATLEYLVGDDVGVVTKWKFPGLFDDMAVSDLFAIQKVIAGGTWRADARSPEWAGFAVAKVLELDVSSPSDRKRIKSMIAVWTETGALKEVLGRDEKRMERTFVEVGAWATT